VTRPRLLDLFCCEGGAAVGYDRAGFDVTGVDLVRRFEKRYPFDFIQADALDYVAEHGHEYDVIHASPPCQTYSISQHTHDAEHPDLIAPLRDLLRGPILRRVPHIIENVVGAPLINPVLLCWSMFRLPGSVLDDDGTPLRMERHRLFESNLDLWPPASCWHPKRIQVAGSYGGTSRDKVSAREIRHGGYVPSKAVQEELLGIDWMTLHGLYQSIPPEYTEHLGGLALALLAEREAVS
jgi:DNA (cytosine-5)-methyltransferase 1